MLFVQPGSTTAAIIAMTAKIIQILNAQSYVRVIALYVSKAFDTVRHAPVIRGLKKLGLPNEVHN